MGLKKLQIRFTWVEDSEHIGCAPKMVEEGLLMGKIECEEYGKTKNKIGLPCPCALRMAQDANISKHSEVLRSTEYTEGN